MDDTNPRHFCFRGQGELPTSDVSISRKMHAGRQQALMESQKEWGSSWFLHGSGPTSYLAFDMIYVKSIYYILCVCSFSHVTSLHPFGIIVQDYLPDNSRKPCLSPFVWFPASVLSLWSNFGLLIFFFFQMALLTYINNVEGCISIWCHESLSFALQPIF